MRSEEMESAEFSHSSDDLKSRAADVVRAAIRAGAESAEAHISETIGFSVAARCGKGEEVSLSHEKSLSLAAFVNGRRGSASSSDLSADSAVQAASRAVAIARNSAADSCFGLADKNLLAREFPNLLLWHPWEISLDAARELAIECEAAAWDSHPKISRDKSEGAEVFSGGSHSAYANSDGFCAAESSTQHGLSCGALAESNGEMERDGWSTRMRDFRELESAKAVGEKAGARAAAKLGARPLATVTAAAMFESPVSHSLIGCIVGAASGGRLYRNLSFLDKDSIGRQIAASHFSLREDPYVPKGIASASYDDEGVATKSRDVVRDGILQGWFLNSYSARRLKTQTTGHAGGAHNLIAKGKTISREEMIKTMRRGIIITELMGQGANLLTGDYSRAAGGFWVENGEIKHPVREVTVAGDLREMLMRIAAVGDDALTRGAITCGSLLIDEITIGGGGRDN